MIEITDTISGDIFHYYDEDIEIYILNEDYPEEIAGMIYMGRMSDYL